MKAEILECRSRAGHAQVTRFPGQRVDRMHGWGDDRGYESIRMGMRQQLNLLHYFCNLLLMDSVCKLSRSKLEQQRIAIVAQRLIPFLLPLVFSDWLMGLSDESRREFCRPPHWLKEVDKGSMALVISSRTALPASFPFNFHPVHKLGQKLFGSRDQEMRLHRIMCQTPNKRMQTKPPL